MIVDRHLGVIADWWFEDRRNLILPTNRVELNKLLKLILINHTYSDDEIANVYDE